MSTKQEKNKLLFRGQNTFIASVLRPLKLVIIDRYVFFQFLKSCFAAAIFFVFMYELTQVFMSLKDYSGEFATPERIILIHLYKLPYNLILFSPLGFLFGTMFTLSNLYKNYEVVTVIGSGVHLFRFTLPVLVFSFVYSLFLIFFGEYFVAPAYEQSDNLYFEVRHKRPVELKTTISRDLKISGEGGLNYNNIGEYNSNLELMKKGIIITRDSSYENKSDINLNEVDKKSFQEISQNVLEKVNIFEKIKNNPEILNPTNQDRVNNKHIIHPETEEINIEEVFIEGINPEPENIFDKDPLPKKDNNNIPDKFLTNISIEDNKDESANEKLEIIESKINSKNNNGKFSNGNSLLETTISITNRRKEYNLKVENITNKIIKSFDYDDQDLLDNSNYIYKPLQNTEEEKAPDKLDPSYEIENLQKEANKDFVNVILGIKTENNNSVEENSEKNNNNDITNNLDNETINNQESDAVINQNEKEIKDLNKIRENENQVTNEEIENINIDKIENTEFKDPELTKINEIIQQTNINGEENIDIVPISSLNEPIQDNTDNTMTLDFENEDENIVTSETNEAEDKETIPYYEQLMKNEGWLNINKYENTYEGRIINLRLNAKCLLYMDDAWYAKCTDNNNNITDAEAKVWEWDSKGNLLFGYPKDLTGQKIDIIKDKPFHFEDYSDIKIETLTFQKGLRVIENRKSSGLIYKDLESKLFGQKIYFPFASFIITLVGIGLGKFHTKKGVLISTFFISLLLFATYYVVYAASESLGKLAYIPIPGFIAPLFANIIFLLLGIFLISKSRT